MTAVTFLEKFPKLKADRAAYVVKWFKARPDIFDAFITKSGTINLLPSYQLQEIHVEVADIVKAFNISSIQSTILNPNAVTATDERESSNLDSGIIAVDSVNIDKELEVTTTTNAEVEESNLSQVIERVRTSSSSGSKLRVNKRRKSKSARKKALPIKQRKTLNEGIPTQKESDNVSPEQPSE